MLNLFIFDVGHGFCAYAIGPNGTNTLFDCGHDDESGFRPSEYLPRVGVGVVNRFVLGNYDSDHVSDLSELCQKVSIETFIRNRSITPEELKSIKLQTGPLSGGMERTLTMHRDWICPPTPKDYAGVNLATFFNEYPKFTDTNNLSLVTFLEYAGMTIIFPGDLEKAGWNELLKNPEFRAWLAKVNIFIASHHGRESGYCEDVFDYCTPDVFIISDKNKIYDSQENIYAKHAGGILWNRDERRYVLTTRCDGTMLINKQPEQGFHVTVGVDSHLKRRAAAGW